MKAYLVVTYEIDEVRLESVLKNNKIDNALNILNYGKAEHNLLEQLTALKKIKSQIVYE